MKLQDLNESVPAMDYGFSEANYGDDPKTKMIVDLGRRLMDMSARMPMGKGVSDEEIEKSNKMSAFGDALTRFNTPMGPKNMAELIKKAGVSPEEAKEFLDMASKAKPAQVKGDDVEPEDEPEDEFDTPDDDEMARKADRMARRGQ
jgi:polyhydroxyalkanoate synthesis regulator phasin